MALFDRRPRRLVSHMNVVPYIDVMLVLLVIFMVTTPLFSPSTIQVPRVEETLHNLPEAQPIEITLDQTGQIHMTRSTDNEEYLSITHPQTFEKIKAWAQESRDQAVPILVSADQDQRYSDVIQIVAALHAGGAKKVALVVKKKQVH